MTELSLPLKKAILKTTNGSKYELIQFPPWALRYWPLIFAGFLIYCLAIDLKAFVEG